MWDRNSKRLTASFLLAAAMFFSHSTGAQSDLIFGSSFEDPITIVKIVPGSGVSGKTVDILGTHFSDIPARNEVVILGS